MAQLKNNQLSKDVIDVRTERTFRMTNNIDTYAAQLGVTGALLAWAQTSYDNWFAAITTAGVEEGQSQEATQTFNLAFEALGEYYQQAKNLLLSIINDIEHDDKIIEAYKIGGQSPRTYDGLVRHCEEMIIEHNVLSAATDPRVLPQAIIDKIDTDYKALLLLHSAALDESKQSSDAFTAQHNLFLDDTDKLKMIYNMAVMAFTNDGDDLLMLGFVPKSEIWTEDNPPYPKNLSFDEPSQTTSWSEVLGDSISYQLDARLEGASGAWQTIYEGTETSTTAAPSESGIYNLRVRAIENGDDLGAWSGILGDINFSNGTAPAVPESPKFVNDMASKRWGWMVDIVSEAVEYEFQTQLEGGDWKTLYVGQDNYVPAELLAGMVSMRARCKNAAGLYSNWTIPVSIMFSELPPFELVHAIISHPAGDPMYHIDWKWLECVGATSYAPCIRDPLGGDAFCDWLTGLTWVYDAELFADPSLTELECQIVAHDDGTGWSRVSFMVTVEVT